MGKAAAQAVCFPIEVVIDIQEVGEERFFFFFFYIGSFDPPCVRSPLDTLESGVLFHIWWLSKQLIVLHDSPPWKVALCLPYPTTPSPPRSQAWGGTINYETLYIV